MYSIICQSQKISATGQKRRCSRASFDDRWTFNCGRGRAVLVRGSEVVTQRTRWGRPRPGGSQVRPTRFGASASYPVEEFHVSSPRVLLADSTPRNSWPTADAADLGGWLLTQPFQPEGRTPVLNRSRPGGPDNLGDPEASTGTACGGHERQR